MDSAVAALLAARAGLELVGVTLTLPGAAPERAAAVCRWLGIKHRVIDVSEQMRERVIEPFCAAYAAGRTPNPCVECNARVKFDRLVRAAGQMRRDAVVTGHYARVRSVGDSWHLLRACDRSKGQSYMLYRVGQRALARAVFPLGAVGKDEARRLATSEGLPVAGRAESQDVCFAPEGDVGALLEQRCPEAVAPGPIMTEDGRRLGTHRGLGRYTVGQRRGLGVGGPGGPWFVLRLEAERNAVIVGPHERLMADRCELERVRIVGRSPGEAFRASVMTRYRGVETPARVTLHDERASVVFDRPHRAPAPGQSAVFYDIDGGERLIGGGIILPSAGNRVREDASLEPDTTGDAP